MWRILPSHHGERGEECGAYCPPTMVKRRGCGTYCPPTMVKRRECGTYCPPTMLGRGECGTYCPPTMLGGGGYDARTCLLGMVEGGRIPVHTVPGTLAAILPGYIHPSFSSWVHLTSAGVMSSARPSRRCCGDSPPGSVWEKPMGGRPSGTLGSSKV